MTPEQHSALVERICESKHFRRANKLKAFLRHICEKKLDGRAEDLKEHEVGTEVFERKPGYNMAEDNIVRVQARLLRNRLERYFEDEGREESIVLRVPRGGYVPEFIERSSIQPVTGAQEPGVATPQPRRSAPVLLVAAAVVVAALVAGAWEFGRHTPWGPERTAGGVSGATRDLYTALLGWPPGRETLIVLSNPRVLLYRRFSESAAENPNLVRIPAHLRDVLSDSLNNEGADGKADYLQVHRTSYTGMGEAATAYHIGILMERLQLPTRLTQGRFLDWEKARTRNMVVLGSPHINDWTLANLTDGEFQIVQGGVLDTVGFQGCGKKYATSYDRQGRLVEDYGVIGLFDLGDTKALLLAGRSSQGTYGVGEFFFDEGKMREVLEALTSDGRPAPASWQALVRMEIQGDLPVKSELVRVASLDSAAPPGDLISGAGGVR